MKNTIQLTWAQIGQVVTLLVGLLGVYVGIERHLATLETEVTMLQDQVKSSVANEQSFERWIMDLHQQEKR